MATAARNAAIPAVRDAARWVAERWAWLLGIAVVAWWYCWIASSSGPLFPPAEPGGYDYYNLLADAFSGGHLYLPVDPLPQLLALPNPYDPVANAGFRIHDMSLYHGRYYMYWGPTPALFLFLPYRWFSSGELASTLAVAVLCATGFAASVGVLRRFVRRYAPEAPRWALVLAFLALATGNATPFMLRRVAVYEVAIAAAFAGAWVGLYLLMRALDHGAPSRRRSLLLLGAGLALAFGMGARVTVLIPALLAVAVAWWLLRREAAGDRPLRPRLGDVALLLGPLLVCGVGLLWYNAARFGSPTEFGSTYQLAGADPATLTYYRPAFIPPGVWYYVAARAHLVAGFPFFELPPPPQSYPLDLPSGFYGVEKVGGLINTPITLLVATLPLALRRPQDRTLRLRLGSLLAVGGGLVLLIAVTIPGATERYVVDFATFFLVPALVVWLILIVRSPRPWARRGAAAGGAALVLWGAAFGVAVSFEGYYNGYRVHDSQAWTDLQHTTGVIPTAVSKLAGHPMIVDVGAGLTQNTNDGPGYAGPVGFDVGVVPVTVLVAAGSPTRADLVFNAAPGPEAGPAPVRLTVDQTDTHRSDSFVPNGTTGAIQLHLKRGLNRIVLSASLPPVVAPGGRLVSLTGVQLRR